MKPLEIFRLAFAEIGDVSAAELSAHIETKHGLKIKPEFIPLYKASLNDLERKLKVDATSAPPKDSTQAA